MSHKIHKFKKVNGEVLQFNSYDEFDQWFISNYRRFSSYGTHENGKPIWIYTDHDGKPIGRLYEI